MSFEEYLYSKKIDSSAYQASEPDQWQEFASIFQDMHPKSFTMQKLNLINGIRRRFPVTEEVVEMEVTPQKTGRPVMKKKSELSAESQTGVSARPVVKPRITSGKSKPVIKPKISSGKPKMTKPVMKPKIKPETDEEKQQKSKPVIKPKTTQRKPKMVRPVIKPKPKD